MTLEFAVLPFPTPAAAGVERGLGLLRRIEDRVHHCASAIADCPWRAALRFVGAVAGVLALIAAAPEIADAVGRAGRWAAGDAAAALERAVLAMAHAARPAL